MRVENDWKTLGKTSTIFIHKHSPQISGSEETENHEAQPLISLASIRSSLNDVVIET
jgi:hypothetical protein